jgi:hypothetical protein
MVVSSEWVDGVAPVGRTNDHTANVLSFDPVACML